MFATYRHSALQVALNDGTMGVSAPMKALQAEMGHQQASTTERYVQLLHPHVTAKSLQTWQRQMSPIIQGGGA